MPGEANHLVNWILVVHQLIGYSTAFIVGPAALMTWKGGRAHRRWGQAYVWGMLTLYLTGTTRTFQLEFTSWTFARNFAFNLSGLLMVLAGWRAICLGRRRDRVRFGQFDRAVTTTLLLLSVGMLLIGLRDLPMFTFGVLGFILVGIDVYELTRPRVDRQMVLSRHTRYMLASYYYLMTVLSIVHIDAGHNLRWLWPTLVGAPSVLLMSRTVSGALWKDQRAGIKYVVRLTILVTLCVGTLVLYKIVRIEGR